MLESMPVILKFAPLLFLFLKIHFSGFNPFLMQERQKNLSRSKDPDVLKGDVLNETEILYG